MIPSSLDAFASFGVNSLDTRAKTTFSNSSRSHASIASTSLNALAYRTRDVARIGQSLDRVTRVQIVDRVVAHAPRDPSRRALETNASVDWISVIMLLHAADVDVDGWRDQN
tara:strand:- start:1548 stop:1883 length:336 start_codon:yes stop_codon:yes gene_type:complete